jgi:mannose-1-phosphate guanylyltransferase
VKGFILAAGFGERLRPLTQRCAKSLMPVLNVPVICYALHLLKEAGIRDILCNLHYRSQDIIDFFEQHASFDLNITFSREEEILGTGGGVKRCEHLIGESDFVLINSDVVMDLDVTALIDAHRAGSNGATLALFRTEEAASMGSIALQGGRVVDLGNIRSTGIASDLIYTGCAVLSPHIFKYLRFEYSSIVDTGYCGLIENHRIGYHIHPGMWRDIGRPSSYWRTNLDMIHAKGELKDRLSSTLGMQSEIVSPGAIVHESARVRDSVIGDGASVGKNAFVEDSVVLPGAGVPDNCTVKSAIVYRDGMLMMY